MTNRLRAEIEEEVVVERKPAKESSPENFFTNLLAKGFITTEAATRALPFILYLALLCMIYIANMHLADKNIRQIEKIGKEVKELNWDYKTTKADLAFKSTLSEVEKRADTLGVKVSLDPPQKLTIEENSDK
ncbi:hypothetical protein KXQ82_16270 [Mucilaginibacter sp. HMF5004]|uniref:FtsL-like putative cell division protein n=1 Tax=Mucilaginibacter rivuli TaxID=2857527 RepID=UPI001C5F0A42|nr:FtsL-like putative cell division protein [Mucilaginibacter rivuli]MBW4891284.1 hypothetical protein [Mucilaginibacter rivuli]